MLKDVCKVIGALLASKMKIAIIRSSSVVLNLQSYNCQEIGLANALAKLGFSTDIFMASKGRQVSITEINSPAGCKVRVFHLPFIALPGKQAVFPDLFSLLNKERYDLIQVHEDSQFTSLVTALYGRVKRVPIVLCQGMYQNYSGFSRSLQIIYDFFSLPLLRRGVSASIAKTAKAKSYLRQKGFNDITVCPVGLDVGLLTHDSATSDVSLPSHLFKDDAINFVYVGILEQRRNVFFIINLFKELLKTMGNIRLIIAGDGPDRERLEREITDQSLVGMVHYLGKISQHDVTALLQKTDAFLLPSNYEIYGMVILEAMYFGVTVFSTPTAGALEIIRDGHNGVIVDSLTISEWQSRIESYFRNKENIIQIRNNAIESINNMYVWDKACKTYVDVYKQIAGAI